tara:strand:- start:4371 stop:5849 length:1479 start_codon:yes stop_codon:yes gene_type:complete
MDTKQTADRKPRFEIHKNSKSIAVKARHYNGATVEFSLQKRGKAKNYSVRKSSIGLLNTTKRASLEEAAREGARIVAAKLNVQWETEEAILSDTRFASIQAIIDAFEKASKEGKLKSKKNEVIKPAYAAALRIVLGYGSQQCIKGVADLSHISCTKLGELNEAGESKVFDDYRNRILSDGNGGTLTCGPTYESKLETFNSNRRQAQALFNERFIKQAFNKLKLDLNAIAVFRSEKNTGSAKVKAYNPPPIHVIRDLDDKVSRLSKEGDWSKTDDETNDAWNTLTLYKICRNSGLRLEELLHLNFGDFGAARKTIIDPETHQPKQVDVHVVRVQCKDSYSVECGEFGQPFPFARGRSKDLARGFKQPNWQAKGKVNREVTIPKFIVEWLAEERKRRGATADQRIVRNQQQSAKTVSERIRDFWNNELIYGTEASDHFKKNLHELRALYGCEIVSATGSLHKAQLALGHSSITTTEQHYAHLITDNVFVTCFGA